MNTAIILGGGGFQGLPVLRALHAIGWRVLIADSISESVNQFEADLFCQVPEVKNFQAFSNEIERLVQTYSVQAIFPTTMYDLPALAQMRPEIEKTGVIAFASTPALIDLISDKRRLMVAAYQHGLPVLDPVDPNHHDFTYALIGKPAFGWGGLGIEYVTSRDEYAARFSSDQSAKYLWQHKLSKFVEWSVDLAIRSDGSLSPLIARRRLRMSGGFAVVNEIVNNDRVIDAARQAAQWLATQGGVGLFNLQFLEEPTSKLWLSDVNPRPGTSSTCALAAGINLVEFLVGSAASTKKASPGLVTRTLKDQFHPQSFRQIQGVVFDLDETLICQKTWMCDKLGIVVKNSPLSEQEHIIKFQQEALRLIDEGPWNKLIDQALMRAKLPSSLAQELIELWRKAHPNRAAFHPDALALIRALNARKIPIALLTDNPASSQLQKIDRLPEDIVFQSIILTDEIGAPKPAPDGFLAAAKELGFPPEHVLMVGDSPWRDGKGAILAGYAGAILVRRTGSMSNPLKEIFDGEFPDVARKMAWTETLFGADRLISDMACNQTLV